MRSGKLRHRVTIQQQAATKNEYNEVEQDKPTSWTDVATVWASVEPLSGREIWAAQQTNAETTVRISMRYLAGLKPDMRIVHSSKIYNIQSIIDPEERHRDLEIMCSEGLNNG